jgi:hypothetical protein
MVLYIHRVLALIHYSASSSSAFISGPLKEMRKKDNNSVSLAGEFAVLSQLALQEFDASMTLGHTKGVDILVSHPGTKRMYRLEVKTKYRTSPKEAHVSKVFGTVKGEWIMDEKHESLIDSSLFYCFVIINTVDSTLQFYIVPSKVVARYVEKEHKHWLKVKSKEGKKVKDTKMRVFRIGFKGNEYPLATPLAELAETYENNWEFRKF